MTWCFVRLLEASRELWLQIEKTSLETEIAMKLSETTIKLEQVRTAGLQTQLTWLMLCPTGVTFRQGVPLEMSGVEGCARFVLHRFIHDRVTLSFMVYDGRCSTSLALTSSETRSVLSPSKPSL
jgi:hypothetical protein